MKRAPDEAAAAETGEAFLSRWSRKKEEARQSPPPAQPEGAVDPKEPAPELPPLDKLTIESDFRAFFHPRVGEEVRRAALKKLFGDPRFNVMDGLDVYIDDYSKTEPIPPEMLAGLRQAQAIIASAKEDEEERARMERAKEQKALKDESAPGMGQPPARSGPMAGEGPGAADAAHVPPGRTLEPRGGDGAA